MKQNDFLSKIVLSEYPQSDLTRDQLMIGILRANHEAFQGGNVHFLKVGQTLKLPDEEVVALISPDDATRTVEMHLDYFKRGQSGDFPATSLPVITRKTTSAPTAPAPAQAEASGSDTLGKDVAVAVNNAVEKQEKIKELEEVNKERDVALQTLDMQISRLEKELSRAAKEQAAQKQTEETLEQKEQVVQQPEQPDEQDATVEQAEPSVPASEEQPAASEELVTSTIESLEASLGAANEEVVEGQPVDDQPVSEKPVAEQPVEEPETPASEPEVAISDTTEEPEAAAPETEEPGEPAGTEQNQTAQSDGEESAVVESEAAVEVAGQPTSVPETASVSPPVLTESGSQEATAATSNSAETLPDSGTGSLPQLPWWAWLIPLVLAPVALLALFMGGRKKEETAFGTDLASIKADEAESPSEAPSSRSATGGYVEPVVRNPQVSEPQYADEHSVSANPTKKASEQEVSLKIDMARAYLDMDYHDAAVEVLHEVLAEGNEDQVDKARNILARL